MKTWIELLIAPVSVITWGLLILALLTFWKSRDWLLRGFALALAALAFALTIPLTANEALGALEAAARRDAACGPPPPGSIIIVLAGGIYGEPPKVTDFSDLKQESIRRLMSAAMLALRTPGSRLLISGGAGGRYREADIMGALARQMGFPASRIMLDRASRTTYQSARNVAAMLAGDRQAPRYLLTSAYHMPRALMAFRDSGQQVCALPVDFRAIEMPPYEMLTPQLSALAKMTEALHEFIGIVFYRLVKFS